MKFHRKYSIVLGVIKLWIEMQMELETYLLKQSMSGSTYPTLPLYAFVASKPTSEEIENL